VVTNQHIWEQLKRIERALVQLLLVGHDPDLDDADVLSILEDENSDL